ncbi:MAG: hypothetical protein WCP07_06300 [bacterium]|jgi:hypothetical protein
MTETIEKAADAIEWVTPRPAHWNEMTGEQQEAAISLQKRFYAAMHRTPEEIEESRRKFWEGVTPARALPEGKTFEDVFVGAIKDDMTDAEVIRLLEELD